MPTARIDDTLEMHYELDDFTPPWEDDAEAILLHHGAGKSGQAAQEDGRRSVEVFDLAQIGAEGGARVCGDETARLGDECADGVRRKCAPERDPQVVGLHPSHSK